VYEAHFGLQRRPFSIAPDPEYLFLGRHHRDALAHLSFGIAERGGFIQLTGVVGTGKTTLTRALLQQLPASVDMALLLNPTVTARELLIAICEELRIDLPSRSHSIPALMTTLRDYLLDAFARGRHTVVLIDEAQNLSRAALEQVRMLTNLETNREKLLQIILVGQPELRDLLARPDLQQVAQRVTARFHLIPLRLAETREYIRHRLQVAGVERPLFSRAASLIIHLRARGIPRQINIICDRALLGAYARGRQQVTAGIALRAAAEVLGQEQRWLKPLLVGGMVSLAAILLGGASLLQWSWPSFPAQTTAASAPQQAPSTPLSLDDYMRSNDPRLDSRVALRQLFALWGGTFQPDSRQTACEQARTQNLRCHTEASGWEALLQRNLPAVLELRSEQGARYGVLLVGLHHGTASVKVGETTVQLPSSQLLGNWTGSAASLWRPPVEVTDAIMPGQRGSAVIWLRRQLDQIEGRPSAAIVSDIYDAALRQRVDAFQRARGLAIDGIVGESTLFHLVLAAPQAETPRLRRS
jgi:general secretion pathway protein A